MIMNIFETIQELDYLRAKATKANDGVDTFEYHAKLGNAYPAMRALIMAGESLASLIASQGGHVVDESATDRENRESEERDRACEAYFAARESE